MENIINVEKEKNQNKKGKKIVIIAIVVLLLLVLGIFIIIKVIPTIKEEGINEILNPTNLTTEEKGYYELFLPELEKYKDCTNDDYRCYFRLYYFEGVDTPLIELEENSTINQARFIPNKNVLFYIKDGKVVTKEYDAVSEVKLLYNTEKDEVDYYLYQVENYDTNNYTYVVKLLKDIATESSSPYVVRFDGNKEYHTTVRNTGQKIGIQIFYAMFGDGIDNYIDNNYLDQTFSFVDGDKEFRRLFRKALSSKYTTKELINDSAKEKGYEQIRYYNIEPGQKIINNTSNDNEKQNTSNSNKNSNTQNQQPTSKCNNGFVYVSDDNRCYSNSETKPVDTSCKNGFVDSPGGCAKKVDSSYCDIGDEQYMNYNGNCIDKYTDSSNPMDCPNGYEILFGNYGGQTFNGACYRYMSPNN